MLLNRPSLLESCPTTDVSSSSHSPSSSSSSFQPSSSSSAATSPCPAYRARLLLTCLLIISSLVVSISAHPMKYPGSRGDTNGTYTSLDDYPQNDEPPRQGLGSNYPANWGLQSQNRTYYMRARNDQYLVIYNNAIYGTRDSRPRSGLVRFFSHKMYVVISSYDTNQFLCLNASGTLYLRKDISPECHLNESTLDIEGSPYQIYEFVNYKHLPKRYLGIDCDDVEMGNDTKAKSVQFIYDPLPKGESPAKHVPAPETCVSERKKRRDAKLRKMLKARWCWNMNRIVKKKKTYDDNCRAKYCLEETGDKCVCDILKNMLNNTRRAKRKCLIAKVQSWVKKQKLIPDEAVIKEVAKRLLPGYQGISKRMQNLAKQKRLKNNQSVSEKPKSRANRTRAANKPIKIKPLLEKFKNELTSGASHNVKQTSSSVSTLSKDFANEIYHLVWPSMRYRYRHRHRKHRSRRIPREINSFLFKGILTNSHKSSSSSPG